MKRCLESKDDSRRLPLCEFDDRPVSRDIQQVTCMECIQKHIDVLIDSTIDNVVSLRKCRDRLEALEADSVNAGRAD